MEDDGRGRGNKRTEAKRVQCGTRILTYEALASSTFPFVIAQPYQLPP